MNILIDIVSKFNIFIHLDLVEKERNDSQAFYKFNINLFCILLDHNDYESNVLITNSTDRISIKRGSYAKIVIIISEYAPINGLITLDNKIFNLHMICHIEVKE